MPALNKQPSILALGAHVARDDQIRWLKTERARNITRAFELLLVGDWHSVKVLAGEIVEDGDDLPPDRPTIEQLRQNYERYRLLLIDRMVEGDWISSAWLAETLQYLECTIRGMTCPQEDRAGRIDYLRERVRSRRHLMQGRESLKAWLYRQSEESAELAGLETS